jgi:spore coat protein W
VNEQNQNPIPKTLIDLLLSDIFQKNGINIEDAKNKLSNEQKEMIKNLVNDLSKQVDSYVKGPQNEHKKEG